MELGTWTWAAKPCGHPPISRLHWAQAPWTAGSSPSPRRLLPGQWRPFLKNSTIFTHVTSEVPLEQCFVDFENWECCDCFWKNWRQFRSWPNKRFTVRYFSSQPTGPYPVQQSPEISEDWSPAISRGLGPGMWRIRKQVAVLSEGKTDYYCCFWLDWDR